MILRSSHDPSDGRRWLSRGWPAAGVSAGLYLVLTVWITWPLTPNVDRQVASDLGDPLFATWALVWVLRHLTRALTGDLTALDQLWDANIFYPERNTLALSDNFVTQAVQVLPVWWVTHNPILAFNISVMASFVLTGLAVFLLTRAFTGGFLAPFLAGAVAAFNPYRLSIELPHVQILSIQWLPFAMLALHRFIESGSRRWLVASGLFLVALNLAAGYYMVFCLPILAAFVLGDLAIQGRMRDWSRWLGLAVAAVCVTLITAPFVLPYIAAQHHFGFTRPFEEVVAYSATLSMYADYVPAFAAMPAALAVLAVLAAVVRRGPAVGAYTLMIAALLGVAFLLSLGPIVQPLGFPGPYALLWKYVPGFDGMRVVSRYAAIFLILLGVLAGIGASILRRVPRVGSVFVVAATALSLWNVWPSTFPLNLVLPSPPLRTPPPSYLDPSSRLPSIYLAVQGLDGDAVIAELPFGDPWYEVRYMFFAATHLHPIMNGYSGFFPASYIARQAALKDPLARPAAAFDALSGATHVVVHQGAWTDDTGPKVVAWLETVGASVIASSDGAELLALNPVRRNARTDPAP